MTWKSWVLWKQQDSLWITTTSKNSEVEKLKSLLMDRWWTPTVGTESLKRDPKRIDRERLWEPTELQRVSWGSRQGTRGVPDLVPNKYVMSERQLEC
jgi:hypothetical protein